jgi:hypothetical protein
VLGVLLAQCKLKVVGTCMQDCLLQAALAPPDDQRCCAIVEMAASVGIMYLSTMAGNLEAPTLIMLASLLNHNRNLLMVENLMAAVWILLRNTHNRKLLTTAFAENPVLSTTLKGQMQVCSATFG